MSYANLYFGKELTQITYQDVETYFKVEKDESNKIEYKSYNPKSNDDDNLNKIFTTICAMLNSEGGIVVWGAPQGQTKDINGKKVKYFVGALTPLPFREKDTFINKATDKITPAPSGIKFQAIEGDSGYIYIIEVEKSFYSPHQFEYVYYMRIDGQNKPAPHYFVEALFRKVTFPRLEGYIELTGWSLTKDKFLINIKLTITNQSRLQNEHDIYYRMSIKEGVFLGYEFHPNGRSGKTFRYNGTDLIVNTDKITLYYNEPFEANEEIVIYTTQYDYNRELEVKFFFAGKQSPLMLSHYKIDISSLTQYSYNLNELIIYEKLNTYIYQDE